MPNIGVISTFPPTQCGIATYSHDLIESLKSISPFLQFIKIELSTCSQPPTNKNYIIKSNETLQYQETSEYINTANIDIVDIQHEFKIFGKPDGENILVLLNNIQKPIITTLHTVSPNLNEKREKTFVEIIKRSDKLYVFSKEAKKHITGKYKKNESSIEILPHGVPEIKFQRPYQIQLRKKFTSNIIFVSAGHMRNTKGYDLAIKALHSLKKIIPDFRYFILGSNHPENESAQSYRETLLELIAKLDLSNQVTFISDYLEERDIIKYIQLADICLLPYTREDQSSSGILALMLACGRPVVSTPFQFATSFLNDLNGTISNSFSYIDFKEAIIKLLNRNHLWNSISRHNYVLSQSWNWKKVAYRYSSGYYRIIQK